MWAAKGAATRQREAEKVEKVERKIERAVKRHAAEAAPAKPARTPPAKRRRSEHEKAARYLQSLNKKFDNLAPIDPGVLKRGLSPKEVLAVRELKQKAHRAYKRNHSRGGGRAREISEQIRAMLGPELAKLLPQLWYYR